MWDFLDYFSTFLKWGILIYSVSITTSYAVLGIISLRALRQYMRRNSFVDYQSILHSPLAPEVSIIAPAYNEGMTIIQNARSLLSLHYPHFEVIIVNDGSKDDGLEKLIGAYDLEPIEYELHANLETKPIRNIYKSKDPGFSRLVVVDKVNGGKADALNVGINVASSKWVVCIDVDCIIEDDALLKLVKPCLEERGRRVIAVGGVVRIANSCEVENGRLVKVHLPKKFLPRVQVLEYLRAFLLGRMAWAKLDGLLLISGAFGMFDKEIAIKAGGYNHKTVGEDMELVVRMRRYMVEHNKPYTVRYTPDPLCWTEAPESFKVLGRQRDRWTRGTMETLWYHRKMFFNPKYGLLGMLSVPYWFFFEWMAPWIESLGMLAFILMAILGFVNWSFVLSLLALVFSFAILVSVFSIFFEEISFYQYKSKADIMRLVLTAMMEPFIYHPLTVFWALKGNYNKVTGNKSWGVMTRVGFANAPGAQAVPAAAAAAQAPAVAPVPEAPATDIKAAEALPEVKLPPPARTSKQYFANGLKAFASMHLVLLGLFAAVRAFETIMLGSLHKLPPGGQLLEARGLEFDAVLWARSTLLLLPVFMLGYYLHRRIGYWLYGIVSVLVISANIGLIQYFKTAAVPLGADFFGYKLSEMTHTVGASGSLNIVSFLPFIVGIAALILFYVMAVRRARWKKWPLYIFYAAIIGAFIAPVGLMPGVRSYPSDKEYYVVNDKLGYFVSHAIDHYFPEKTDNIYNEFDMAGISDKLQNYQFISDDYPFLHKEVTADVLSPYFDSTLKKPNIVFILVESLGRGYCGPDAYLGSFTPFIDSLIAKSLYWENGLSGGGRTFAVLPTVFGSLPFADKGFLEMGDAMPAHQSLIKIMNANGYKTRFFYGGDSHFDNMDIFLNRNEIGEIIDEKTFGAGYTKLPASDAGFTWGYGDKELFRKSFDMPYPQQPTMDIFLTLAMHSPFLIPGQQSYIARYKARMASLNLPEVIKAEHEGYDQQYSTMLFTDDALRTFFKEWEKRPEYKNTIFIITGDHRMPEIPVRDKIDRFHVPIIIYSPALKRPARFAAVGSHFDLTPTLLAYLRHKGFKSPDYTQWIGYGLDTVKFFKNTHIYPIMRNKNELLDYLVGTNFLSDNQAFKITPGLAAVPTQDAAMAKSLEQAFAVFKQKNDLACHKDRIIPDSLRTR